jgi:hypothetical protein
VRIFGVTKAALTVAVFYLEFNLAACAQMLIAFERNKMMKAVAGRIPVWLAGLLHTLGHHLSGGFFVVRFFFFFFFTVDANGLMVDNR